MTVRWRPLIVLSGLFVTIGLIGLLAFVFVIAPGDVGDVLAQARTARENGRFEDAKIYYLQAVQLDGRNAAIHQEMADFYAEWRRDPGEANPEELANARLRSLVEAARRDKSALEPRRALLSEALNGDDAAEQRHWAEQVIALDPTSVDALFVLAEAALNENPPNLSEAERFLEGLKGRAADRARTLWIEARIARENGRQSELKAVLERFDGGASAEDEPAIDAWSRLRLTELALETAEETETDGIDRRIAAIVEQAQPILETPSTPASRVVEIAALSRRVRATLEELGMDPERAEALGKPLMDQVDAGFRSRIESDQAPGLWFHHAYARHLAERGEHERCLEVAKAALELPAARNAALADDVMRLHETAIKVALADAEDPERYAKAKPHIEGLLGSSRSEYQGLGHLFQGAIDLERSGLAGVSDGEDALSRTEAATFLKSARDHLRQAARRLPNIPTAQALHGIALVLSGETALGRQYLQTAQRSSSLEPRYRVWAAWTMIQAGYPEEAEPILEQLAALVETGDAPAELELTIETLQGEIAHARRSPEDLELVRAALERSAEAADAEDVPIAVALRQAELALVLEGPEAALERIDALREAGRGAAAVEALAIATLSKMDRDDEARMTLEVARRAYPESSQLAALDASLLLKQGQAEEAARSLAAFLEAHPEDVTITQLRARILAEELERIDDARQLLIETAERTETTAPLVQLVLLDMRRGALDEVERTVAKVKARWPEAAAGDLLDAQLSLAKRDLSAAARHLEHALRKDPTNKIALFWKAQIDASNGSKAQAARAFETIIQDGTVKELEDGLPLSAAAQWSMAQILMDHNDLDGAILRLEALLEREDAGAMSRAVRWKLAEAHMTKGDWKTARQELIDLLRSPEATHDERTRAANAFRINGEPKAARSLIERVRKDEPYHPGAVVVQAFLLAGEGKRAEAAAMLREAAEHSTQPPATYLMIAGLESQVAGEGEAASTAAREAIERGLEAHPDSIDLARANYELIRDAEGVEAALGFAEEKAETSERPRFRRFLADVYAAEEHFEAAERTLEGLIEQNPEDPKLAVALVSVVASQAIEAARRGDDETEAATNLRLSALIQDFREQFPNDVRFAQADCELAMRQGDFTKAEAIARGIDRIDPDSVVGPLLRAMIQTDQGLNAQAVDSYREALERDPLRDDVRLALGDLLLSLGRAREARLEADRILARSPKNQEAILLRASAIAAWTGGTSRVSDAQRRQAIEQLSQAIQEDPDFRGASHLKARIEREAGDLTQAVETLQAAGAASGEDPDGLALLIQYLAEPRPDGSPPSAAERSEAEAIAQAAAEADRSGRNNLAIAVGYHRAGRPDLALPWAERASETIATPAVWLNHGDILLSLAESIADPSEARRVFLQAIEVYDRVIAANAESVEAVNNKAWILHRYLDRHDEARALVENFLNRVDRQSLPSAFFDTVGAIYHALGRDQEAEDAFAEGLRKSPDHAVLNYHMGRLLAQDDHRADHAARYLEKAKAAEDQLPLEIAREVDRLLERVGR